MTKKFKTALIMQAFTFKPDSTFLTKANGVKMPFLL